MSESDVSLDGVPHVGPEVEGGTTANGTGRGTMGASGGSTAGTILAVGVCMGCAFLRPANRALNRRTNGAEGVAVAWVGPSTIGVRGEGCSAGVSPVEGGEGGSTVAEKRGFS